MALWFVVLLGFFFLLRAGEYPAAGGGFDLAKAFSLTDEEFCKHFGVDKAELQQAKRNRYRIKDDEKDYLWNYVHSI